MILKNKTVTVVGLGKSGFAAAKFLLERGARVRVTEGGEKQYALERAEYLRGLGASVETGGHTDASVDGSAWVVVSPGVPCTAAPVRRAVKKRIPVISEIELAWHFCPGKIVAVTGSNGKTTTCHLLYRMVRESGRPAVLCGNVGFSFLDALAEIRKNTVVVLELSSFQLEESPSFRPKIAVALNVSPNHLDRHGTMGAYVRAKENIFRNQRGSDLFLYNGRDPVVGKMARKARGRKADFLAGRPIFDPENMMLRGAHNFQNAMAAAAAAKACGISSAAIRRAAEKFSTLEHRIEPLGQINGVRFVNDSKSTTVASTRAAILAVEGPIVLIAGGRPKGASFAEIEPLLIERVKQAVLYGEARAKIAESWLRYPNISSEFEFDRAVERAFDQAKPGDTILLSPMCTSFDQFSSFEARGEAFKRAFVRLGGTPALPVSVPGSR